MERIKEILKAVDRADLPKLEDADAEGRAGTLLIEIFGYKAFCQFPEELMDRLYIYVGSELELVARRGFTTMPMAQDCIEMTDKQRGEALPGMIRWEDLKEAQDA